MRHHLFTIIALALSLTACAVDEQPEVATSTSALATPYFIADPTRYQPGRLHGQDSWTDSPVSQGPGCEVQNDGSYPVASGRFIRCAGGSIASKPGVPVSSGRLWLQIDFAHTAAVVNGTIGKLSVEGPQGRAFQFYIGCGGLRLGAEMGLPQIPLKQWPCSHPTTPQWHRIACEFTIGERVLQCGVGAVTDDDIPFTYTLNTANPLRPIDRVEVTSYPLPGAVKLGRVYIYGL